MRWAARPELGTARIAAGGPRGLGDRHLPGGIDDQVRAPVVTVAGGRRRRRGSGDESGGRLDHRRPLHQGVTRPWTTATRVTVCPGNAPAATMDPPPGLRWPRPGPRVTAARGTARSSLALGHRPRTRADRTGSGESRRPCEHRQPPDDPQTPDDDEPPGDVVGPPVALLEAAP